MWPCTRRSCAVRPLVKMVRGSACAPTAHPSHVMVCNGVAGTLVGIGVGQQIGVGNWKPGFVDGVSQQQLHMQGFYPPFPGTKHPWGYSELFQWNSRSRSKEDTLITSNAYRVHKKCAKYVLGNEISFDSKRIILSVIKLQVGPIKLFPLFIYCHWRWNY